MWVLLTIFVTLFSGVNQFFSLRYVRRLPLPFLTRGLPLLSQPSLTIGYVVCQLLVFPIGRAWEKLPRWRVGGGRFYFDINPGVFSIKEHAIITIVSRRKCRRCSATNYKVSFQCVNLTASTTAYGAGALVAINSPQFWNRDYGAGFSFLYLLTSQGLG